MANGTLLRPAWILSIFIKPECRSGARLRQSVYAVDNDMLEYFGKRPAWSNDVSRFQNSCLNEQVIGRAADNRKTASCVGWLANFFDAQKYGVVYDHWWPGSGFWYIRDASCVQRIDATPLAVIRMVKDTNDFFSLSPFVSGLKKAGEASNSGIVLFDILLNAISQLRPNDVSLEDWKAAVSKVDYAAADLQANSLESRTAKAANLTLRMATICQKLGRLPVLQAFIRNFRTSHNGHLRNNQLHLYQAGFIESFERFLDSGSCE